VRRLFERALTFAGAPELGTCPVLWRSYLAYEAASGRHGAAKRTLLRGMHACPWSKALLLDGLALLPADALPPKEQADLLEVVRQKGVRVRTLLLEVLLEAAGDADVEMRSA